MKKQQQQQRDAAGKFRQLSFFERIKGKVRAFRYRNRRMLGGRDYQTREGNADE